jgi:hypothetical protein
VLSEDHWGRGIGTEAAKDESRQEASQSSGKGWNVTWGYLEEKLVFKRQAAGYRGVFYFEGRIFADKLKSAFMPFFLAVLKLIC